MTQKEIRISYMEYSSKEELETQDRELVNEAIEAMKGAYAPYSGYHVGSAVRLTNGMIVRGANQENAAFPSGMCAERTAMFAAGANYPEESMTSIAVAGGPGGVLTKTPASPCGACRQTMAQYQLKSGKPVTVLLAAEDRILKFAKVDDILPLIFDGI